MTIFAFTRHTGVRVAEVGFAVLLLAGVLLAVAPVTRFGRSGAVAGGIAVAVGSALVIIAIRWGSFGSFF